MDGAPVIKTFHLYRRDDGLYAGASITCASDSADAMAGAHCVAIPDVEHPHAMRLVEGVLVEHRGASPGADYEWNTRLGRWWMRPDIEAKAARAAATLAQIESLEKQQSRALREQAIGRGGTPAQLRKRLEDIDDQIIALRATLAE